MIFQDNKKKHKIKQEIDYWLDCLNTAIQLHQKGQMNDRCFELLVEIYKENLTKLSKEKGKRT